MQLLAGWTDEHSPAESLELIQDLALFHCREGGEQGYHIADLILSCDYRGLVDFELDYSTGHDVTELAHCRQALGFYQKAEFLDLGIDRVAVGYEKFKKSEINCQLTNSIFDQWSRGNFQFFPGVDAVLYRASQKIQKVLGPVPKLSELRLRFGPGSTTSTKKRHASVRRKLLNGFQCSENLEPYVQDVLFELPQWVHTSYPTEDHVDAALVPVTVVPGKLTFVPKNAKTTRAVVTEPSLNVMVQLGIGDHIARRLAAFGVDISDQTINQRRAREGSLTNALATLDLSSASDTISRELVFHLLPLDWACFLDRFRSRSVQYGSDTIVQAKFSSMGNGYTFPLETLIFWALTVSVCDDNPANVSVYGDDIICPTVHAPEVITILETCGFSINREKSYIDGPFRESCGSDWYLGIDIRPCYQRKLVSPSSLFVLHNFYKRTNQEEAAHMVLERIHPALRIFGPDGYGDGHLLGDWLPRPHKRKIGWGGFVFETFSLRSRVDKMREHRGDYALPSYVVYRRHPMDVVPGPLPRKGQWHGNPFVDQTAWVDTLPGSDGYRRISIYTFKTA